MVDAASSLVEVRAYLRATAHPVSAKAVWSIFVTPLPLTHEQATHTAKTADVH